MTDHQYFSVEPTTCTIQERGALAIYCGDAPRRNEADGTTSHSLRGPLLIMPPGMWSDPKKIAEKVAKVLNENAHLFFDSARIAPMTDPIAAARALIEPLTGYTPGPWDNSTPDELVGTMIDDRYEWSLVAIVGEVDRHHKSEKTANARLIAAAPDLRDMAATLADALEAERAKVAAAYEAAACVTVDMGPRYDGRSVHYHIPEMAKDDIRALTPSDAQAALDKLLAEARLEGWRAGRDAAAHACDWGDIYGDNAVRAIRALPEPKEARHDL